MEIKELEKYIKQLKEKFGEELHVESLTDQIDFYKGNERVASIVCGDLEIKRK